MSSELAAQVALHTDPPEVIVRCMLTFDRAVDDHLGDCARRGFTRSTLRTYRRTYDLFGERLPRDQDVSKITTDDLRRFLNAHGRLATGTVAGFESHLASLFGSLYLDGKIARNPMDRVIRTRRKRSEDLDVVTVSTDDIRRLILTAARGSWTERLCVAVLAGAGPRRHAAALLRLSDYAGERYEIIDGATVRKPLLRFREKGNKTIWKPVQEELDSLIRAAVAAGVYVDSLELLADSDHSGDPYLIPPEAKLRKIDRDDRVIWRTVKDVAARAGVDAHVHALRAGFAVAYIEAGGDSVALQELLGHRSPETTRIYLRKLNKQQAMEPVRSFSYGVSLLDGEPHSHVGVLQHEHEASPVVGAGGFEPPYASIPHGDRDGRQHLESDLLTGARDSVEPPPEVPA